jgi:hypothetical protein
MASLTAPPAIKQPSRSFGDWRLRSDAADERRIRVWVLGAIAVAWMLRAPFMSLPLRLDEGGLGLVGHAFVAAGGHADGSMYGGLWIDRPPLLILLYGLAQVLGGAVGIRVLGALAAAAVIGLSARIVAQLGYRRAVPIACLVAVALTSSPALTGSFAYPELLASAVVAGVMLRCLQHLQAPRPIASAWFITGLLATSALLLKQSFLDGVAVGLVGATWMARRHGWRATIAPYAGGIAAAAATTVAWAETLGPGTRELTYAMFGFRIAGAEALRASPIPMSVRFHHLAVASIEACLPLLLPAAIAAIVVLYHRGQRGKALLAATWLGTGIIGVLGGGYYWSHYMLQLVPVLAVLAAIAVSLMPRRAAQVAFVAIGAAAVTMTSLPPLVSGRSHLHQASVLAASRVVADNRQPSDRVLVLYSRANAAYYTGVRPAFAYQWSLMYLAIPGVERELNQLLASPRRPTWIIRWQRPGRFGLDRDGATARLVARSYRVVDTSCGHDVLLERGDTRQVGPRPHLSAADCRR